MMTVVIPQLQLVENSALASMKTAEVPQLPFIDEVAAHCRDELTGGNEKAVCTGTRPAGSCPRTRLGVFEEPGAQWVDAALTHRAVGVLSLALSSLAGSAGEAVSEATLTYLQTR